MSSKGTVSHRGAKNRSRRVLRDAAARIDALEARRMLAADPVLWIDDPTVPEGDSGLTEVHFPLWLTEATDHDVTVNYRAASNSATVGIDLPVQSGTLTIPAGQTIAEIIIYIYGDTEAEKDEMFRVYLEDCVGATVERPRGSGIIMNDDKPTLSIRDAQVVEGDDGTRSLVFTASLNSAISTPVTFHYSTSDGSAKDGVDYTGVFDATATIPPLADQITISIPVIGNTVFEANKTFGITLSDSPDAILGNSTATGTILNDDAPNLSIGDASMSEGHAGTSDMVFTVTLNGPTASDVTFDYTTSDGTATAGQDYQAASGTATIPAGQTSVTIHVPITGDTVEEAAEAFNLALSNVSGAVAIDGSATGTIVNDDTHILSVADVSMNEGNSGTTDMVFTVSLDVPAVRDVTFQYATAGGKATPGSDYLPVAGTGTILAGQSSVTIHVPIVGNHVVEGNESFQLLLSGVSGATVGKGSAIGTIVNDDHDAKPPAASLKKLAQVAAKKKIYRFSVLYRDAGAGLNLATIGNQDVLVKGPRGYKALATLVGRTAQGDGSVLATYQVPAPGGTWNRADNGAYSLWLRPGQVKDLAGNMAGWKLLGVLRVNIAAAAAVKALAPSQLAWLLSHQARVW